MGGTMYAVAGGKGGVGKTTTALNLAAAFETGGTDTAVVDADLEMTNLGDLAGIDNEHSVHDVLSGRATVEEATVEGPGGVTVLAGEDNIDAVRRAETARLRDVFHTLRTNHETVVADTGAGLTHAALVPYGLADGVVMVTTDNEVAALDVAKTAEMVREVDGTVLGVVVTRTSEGTDADATADTVGEPLLESVPEAPDVAGEEPMVLTAPGSGPAQAYQLLAGSVEAAGGPAHEGESSGKRVRSPTQD
ncbi:septum site-determining protein MinD [Halobacteriales archaeon SW_7_68_16]|nr:MAG: septum site-determining protein MinD [Halobacteriales archaeon SW_7_68_16]